MSGFFTDRKIVFGFAILLIAVASCSALTLDYKLLRKHYGDVFPPSDHYLYKPEYDIANRGQKSASSSSSFSATEENSDLNRQAKRDNLVQNEFKTSRTPAVGVQPQLNDEVEDETDVFENGLIRRGVHPQVIVIGATGNAGSIIVARLAMAGVTVWGLGTGDNRSTSLSTQCELVDYPFGQPIDYPEWADAVLSREGAAVGYNSEIGFVTRVEGGGPEINGQTWLYPEDADTDAMEQKLGLTKWSTAKLKKYHKTIEKCIQFGTGGTGNCPVGHGTNGYMTTIAPTPDSLLAVFQSAIQNVTNTVMSSDIGLGKFSNTTGNFYRDLAGPILSNPLGQCVRESHYRNLLVPVLASNPSNVHMIRNSQAVKVGRTDGCKLGPHDPPGTPCFNTVSYISKNGKMRTIKVADGGKIIIAAGATETPRILFHSGIGPCDMLNANGVRCLIDLPVATAFKDHFGYAMLFESAVPADAPLHRGSISATYYAPASDHTNMELSVVSLDAIAAQVLFAGITLTKPYSNGTMELKGKDWFSPLKITYGLSDPRDFASLVQSFKDMRAASIRAGIFEVSPGYITVPLTATDAQIQAWIAGVIAGDYHTTVTAPLGVVLDQEGRVIGSRGLEVMSQAATPLAWTGHTTMAGVSMLAEHYVDMLLNRGVLSP